MKKSLPLSDEMLNAYIDGEIDGIELERIIAQEATDKEFAATICEMRKLKNLVQAARAPEPEKNSSYILNKCKSNKHLYRNRRKLYSKYFAASFFILILLAASSYIDFLDPHLDSMSASVFLDENSLLVAANNTQNLELLMHFKSRDVKDADKLLSVLESALIKSREKNNNLRVEVVVSGPGLHLLQKTSLSQGNKIRLLQKKYQNLTFLACAKTLQKVKMKSEKDVQIIEEAIMVASGPEWVNKRKARGWSYFVI